MQCDTVKEMLVSYIYEDEISWEQKRQLNEHLQCCAPCRRELAELESARFALNQWQDEEVSDRYIFVRPEGKPELARPGGWLPSWAATLARASLAAAALAIVCFVMLAAANTQITWEHGKFTFRASLLGKADGPKADGRRLSDEELLRIVDRMIEQSELRINRHYTASLQEMVDYLEARRQADLGLISEGMRLLYREYDKTRRLVNARNQN